MVVSVLFCFVLIAFGLLIIFQPKQSALSFTNRILKHQ